YFRYRRETSLVRSIVAAERPNIIERPRLAAHHPVPGDEVWTRRVLHLRFEYRLIEAGRQNVDKIDIAREFPVLLASHAGRNEDSQMTHLVMDRVDDRLSMGADLIDILIEVENPSERLLRRRNVITARTEHHDRSANVPKVDGGAVRRLD